MIKCDFYNQKAEYTEVMTPFHLYDLDIIKLRFSHLAK